MRYFAPEKLEIIRLVEKSHLPAKQKLDRLGIARPTFYRWYDLYQRFGENALDDRRPGPRRAWNRMSEEVQDKILDMALVRGAPFHPQTQGKIERWHQTLKTVS